MAKSQQRHQQQQSQRQQQQQQHSFTYSSSLMLCGITILLLCGMASGNGNMNAPGSHNNTMPVVFQLEQRIRRDVPALETEVQQATVVSQHTGEPERAFDKQISTSQTNELDQSFVNPFRELNIIKRAPNGFIGMRGKKEAQDDDDNNSNSLDWNLNPLYHHPVIGVEDDYEDSFYGQNERFKKAPTAFYGVRGKKFPNHDGSGYLRFSNLLQQLEEERLRETMLEDFIGRLAVATASENEINKRAPTGFTGLRGKRPAEDWTTADELQSYEKRAPVNAFVGVRGKKDMGSQQEMHQTLFKRSPSESFGGKRRLADFNNKFVAVRGKKNGNDGSDADDDDDELSEQAGQFIARQRLRYLIKSLPSLVYDGQNSKRAPNGFIGMRGKRATKDAQTPSAGNKISTSA